MGSVRQNPIQRTVRTAHLSVLMTAQLSVHNTAQNSSDNFPSYLQTIIIAQMLSIGGEGGLTIMNWVVKNTSIHVPILMGVNAVKHVKWLPVYSVVKVGLCWQHQQPHNYREGQNWDTMCMHWPMSCIRSLCVWNHVRFGRARISSRCSNMFWALFAFSSVTLSSFSSCSAASIALMSSSSWRIRSRYFSITSATLPHTQFLYTLIHTSVLSRSEMTLHTFKRQLKSYLFHIWCAGEQKEHSPPPGAVVAFSWFWHQTQKLQTYLLTYLPGATPSVSCLSCTRPNQGSQPVFHIESCISQTQESDETTANQISHRT